ncbi:ABC transporter substrate-binding protein [Marinobacter sp. 71-i]|uniref:ABC transporter substrate-binding protein n=1 Tax=Marinobacter iranensis TaxID=2962607 RepID=A0ABT5Y772_9GAMM|nr:ABC transporter substrate-binding protein [Marinobacter iranensis]MDF0749419.1 ABC transporter substrate-binding protein [Marinobacter iranensis]
MRLITALFCACAMTAAQAQESRIISADGAITETIIVLGAGELLAGVDTTSHYPPEAIAKLPKVGYLRALPVEGVLSLRPTRLITTEEAGPRQTLDRIAAAGVDVVQLPVARDVASALARIRRVGELVDREAQADNLTRQIADEIETLKQDMAGKPRARVLILLAAGDHGVMLAGKDTAAHALLQSLGLQSALSDVSGYKPASREALLASDPDAIVIAEARPGQFRQEEWPELTQLRAWKHGNRVTANAMMLLGFGPRLAEALQTVAATVPDETALSDAGPGAHAH